MTQPHPSASQMRIEVRGESSAGEQLLGPVDDYGPDSWRSRVADLRDILDKFTHGEQVGLLTCERIPDEFARVREHVVHQASGIRWIELPAGFVDDRVNNGASGDEGHLYSTGTLGFLLPMYLNKTKSVSFPSSHGRKVTVANHFERGFEISLHDGEKAAMSELPARAGAGELAIRVPVEQPEPHRASRALAKAAYLALCVHAPSLALRDELGELRDWIVTGGPEGHRPYCEKLLPGTLPGAEFNYYFVGDCDDQGQLHRLENLVAFVRIHCVGFWVSMVGQWDFEELCKGDSDMSVYQCAHRESGVRLMTFTFGFERIEQK